LKTTTRLKLQVAQQISNACREYGFFYIVGHGVDETLQKRLEALSRQFFELPLEQKLEIKIPESGHSLLGLGYFQKGSEFTSGKPDIKEGVYFSLGFEEGDKLGRNLFSQHVSEFREIVLEYMAALTRLSHALLEGIALSLGLDEAYFYERYTKEPFRQFALFRYPKCDVNVNDGPVWGVGEHTDYGVLTILKQDECGGLQVKSKSVWIDAPPVYNSFVCNIGDMLDRMTGGLYKSTLHRVKAQTSTDRFSYPFFFDPNLESKVSKIENITTMVDDKEERWDNASVHEFNGTYGDYLLKKVYTFQPTVA
jgi:isopenicillin N synthase-like dioxygenase